MDIKNIFSGIYSFINNNKKNPIFIGISSLLFIIIIISLVFILKATYSLSKNVRGSSDLVPEDVVYYFEVYNPEKCFEQFENSSLSKNILNSEAWKNFLASPGMKKIFNILYFLEVKAGVFLEMKDIPTFLGGSTGYAKMPDNSFLITAKTNLKSKVGALLYTAFNSKKIDIKKDVEKPKTKETNDKQKVISKDDYSDIYKGTEIDLSNIKVSKFEINGNKLFITLLDDYLFFSDSLDTLKSSLRLASGLDKSSLKSITGIKKAVNSMEDDNFLFYIKSKGSIISPIAATINGSGLGFLFHFDDDSDLNADIYLAGWEKDEKKQEKKSKILWSKVIPDSSAITFYSNNMSIKKLYDDINTLGGNWEDLAQGVNKFFKASRIDVDKSFDAEGGSFLTMHSLEYIRPHLYPMFSFGYTNDKKEDKLAKSLFKTGGLKNDQFQGKNFKRLTTFRGQVYTPAVFEKNNFVIVSSRKMDTQNFISADNGNREVLNDTYSFKELDDFSDAPHHLIIDVKKLISSMNSFYIFGASHSSQYSEKTIDRDIMPLFMPFEKYGKVHMSYGLNEEKTGKLVVTEK